MQESKLARDLTLVIILMNLSTVLMKRNWYAEIINCNFSVNNPKLVQDVGCWTGRKGYLSYFSAEFMVLKNLKEFDINFKFDILKKDSSRINLVNMELSGCKYFEGVYTKYFMKVGLTELMRVSNLPRRCPLTPHKLYYIKNFTVDPEDYPAIVPLMTWSMHIGYLLDHKDQGGITVMGRTLRQN